jgi:hypothetical protein
MLHWEIFCAICLGCWAFLAGLRIGESTRSESAAGKSPSLRRFLSVFCAIAGFLLVVGSLKVLRVASPGIDWGVGGGLLLVFALWSGQAKSLIAQLFASE